MITVNTDIHPNIEILIKDLENSVKIKPDTLKEITKTIRKGIEYNIEHGLTYMGSPVAPLSLYTIMLKGNSRPLVDTGLLLNSIRDELTSKNSGVVFVNSIRAQIAQELNDGKQGMKARPFFGLSKSVLDEIDRVINKSIG